MINVGPQSFQLLDSWGSHQYVWDTSFVSVSWIKPSRYKKIQEINYYPLDYFCHTPDPEQQEDWWVALHLLLLAPALIKLLCKPIRDVKCLFICPCTRFVAVSRVMVIISTCKVLKYVLTQPLNVFSAILSSSIFSEGLHCCRPLQPAQTVLCRECWTLPWTQ